MERLTRTEEAKLILKEINQIFYSKNWEKDLYSKKTKHSLWAINQQIFFNKILSELEGKKDKKEKIFFWLENIIFFFLSISSNFFFSFLCRIKQKEIGVYAIYKGKDKDFRLKKFFSFLDKERIEYGNIVYCGTKSLVWRAIASNRFPLFIKTPLPFPKRCSGPQLEKEDLQKIESEQYRKIISKLFPIFIRLSQKNRFEIKFLSFFLKASGIKKIFAIDDYRHMFLLTEAAHESRVNIIFIQHGRFNKSLGWLNDFIDSSLYPIPEEYLLKNEFWRKALLKNSNIFTNYTNRLKIFGSASEDISFENKENKEKKEIISILIPYETATDHEEIRSIVEEIKKDKKYYIFFRPRPDLDKEKQLKDYSLPSSTKIVEDINSFLKNESIDFILGTYTTLLYEFAAVSIPSIIVETKNTDAFDLFEEKLGFLVRKENCTEEIAKKHSDLSWFNKTKAAELVIKDDFIKNCKEVLKNVRN
ncbi:MAG: hypothetical protein FJY91_00650 [Candidatus Harrisonbacteria bacterium]|nr:hypothetical protein [Candidatus Harrisonbacteria bacterium]